MAAFTVAVCTLVRIILLFNEQTVGLSMSFFQWVEVFVAGAINDLCFLTIA